MVFAVWLRQPQVFQASSKPFMHALSYTLNKTHNTYVF